MHFHLYIQVNNFVCSGSNLFNVKKSGSGESQVKLTTTWNIGIKDFFNPEANNKVKGNKWNHIYLRVSTGIYLFILIVFIKMTNPIFPSQVFLIRSSLHKPLNE